MLCLVKPQTPPNQEPEYREVHRDGIYVGSYFHVQWQQPKGWRPKYNSDHLRKDIGALAPLENLP